jgi:hypothetical protein
MQFGIGDGQMMDFSRRAIPLFEQRADLAAGLGPGLHLGHIAPQK